MINKKGQQPIIEWGLTAVILLILLYVFFQVGKTFCQVDSSFCGYFSTVIGAFLIGIVWFLKFGNRR